MTQNNLDLNSVVIATNLWEYSPDNVTLMEWVSRYAGVPLEGRALPLSVEGILGTYAQELNDAMPADRMQGLVPFIPLLAAPQGRCPYYKRAFLCADRAMRVFALEGLKAAGLNAGAARLAAAKPIVDEKTAHAAVKAARAAVRAEGKTNVSEAVISAIKALDAATRAASASEGSAYAATRHEHYSVKAQRNLGDSTAAERSRRYSGAEFEAAEASASLAVRTAEHAAKVAEPALIWDAALQLLRDLIEIGK